MKKGYFQGGGFTHENTPFDGLFEGDDSGANEVIYDSYEEDEDDDDDVPGILKLLRREKWNELKGEIL